MIKNSDKKYWILTLVALFLFLAIFLYFIESAIPDREFVLLRYVRDVFISFLFLVFLAWIDYKFIVMINNSLWLSRNILIRIITEGSVLSVFASVLVVVANIPFQNKASVLEYIISAGYKEALVAGILLNFFTITVIEFFVHAERTRKLQNDIAQMQYQQLKSQINPHFLFNSLNVLISLINKDADKATDYTRKLSIIYRYVLSYDIQETVFLEEEMDFIRNYIDILKIRFGDGLNVAYNIKSEDHKRKIPPMTLQVLVENAVKHNAITASAPLLIQIYSDEGDIVVTNNIIPRIRTVSSLGIGLKNLNEKFMILSGRTIGIVKNEHEFTVKLPLL